MVEAARRRGEIAIGYRQLEHASDSEKRCGVVLKLPKSRSVSFAGNDRIIVAAS